MRQPLHVLAHLYDPEGCPHLVYGWARYGVLVPTITATYGSVDIAALTVTRCLAVQGYRFEPKAPELEALAVPQPTTEQLIRAFKAAMQRIESEYP